MKWFTDIISGGVKDFVSAGGDLVDRFIETPDEKTDALIKLEQMGNDLELKLTDASIEYDKQVTARHANDMTSDSWLSKNIRPLGLVFTLISFVTLMFASTFSELTDNQSAMANMWAIALGSIIGSQIVFYYGSRGFEKIKSISLKKS